MLVQLTGPYLEGQHAVLYDWAVLVLYVPVHDSTTIHVVGANPATGRGRVSSHVTRVHVSAQRVITQSGRIYDLIGEPGPLEDCLAMVKFWSSKRDTVVMADLSDRFFKSGGRIDVDEAMGVGLTRH